MKLIFDVYDFDNDGLISQKDIITIISCMPVIQSANVRGEGKYTKEGGGAQSFQERVDTLEEMLAILQDCFGNSTHLDLQQFQKITEEKSSDMALSILSLLRERLPCSENYWRYRRNFELHKELHSDQPQPRAASPNSEQKVLAQAHMSFVKNLSAYNQGSNIYKPQGSPKSNVVDHPAFEPYQDEDVEMASENTESIQIPVPNFRSNHIANKLVLFNEHGEVDRSKQPVRA
jgi:hypothetical protein